MNWPFVYPALQEANPELAKQVGWARIPGIDEGTPSKVTIGGVNLAVSSYSKHPEESFEAARCIRSAEHQKFSAINDGVPPTIEAVYDDPEMAEAYPMKDTILEELKEPATRPLTPAYQSISTVMSAILSPPSGDPPAADRRRAARRHRRRPPVQGGPAVSARSEPPRAPRREGRWPREYQRHADRRRSRRRGNGRSGPPPYRSNAAAVASPR